MTSTQQVFVVNKLKPNLLGLPALTSLNLAARLDASCTAEEPTLQSRDEIMRSFPKVFQGLGNLGSEYHIELKPDAKPYSLFTPRRIPLPLRPKVLEELQRMEEQGVISKVTAPTPWCAGMVAVPKKSGAVRLCVDLKPLNKSVLREVHPLPKVDETLAQLSGAKLFSKLDANSGFWQIPLSQPSRLLTTFITPVGRYCFNKLPFGISSAPEHFQRRMTEILEGLPGVLCQMDDMLVFGKDQAEHNTRLNAVLSRIEEAGVTLNSQKCEFNKTSLKFLGHVIDSTGIRADPEKTTAITKMDPSTSVPELRRFMGMVNQLGKFTPNLAELTQPLRELLSNSRSWTWSPAQQQAFENVKAELAKPTTLVLYDPGAETKISADASSHGLGAVLLQRAHSEWKPVAYASRSMSPTEKRYAQIEKEALATTWACEKFSDFILGKHIDVETDQKPLVPLLGHTHLDSLPPRILRFRLRLDRFTYTIRHVPGKQLHIADTLSRAPQAIVEEDTTLEHLAELAMMESITHLPASAEQLEVFHKAQSEDPTCATLLQYCRNGWPGKHLIDPTVKPYWEAQSQLTIRDGILLYGGRIVVPQALQGETLSKLHEGHQGIVRCRLRANMSVWWPGLSKRICSFIKACPECSRNQSPNKEPLMPTPLPTYPWQKVGTYLFVLKGENHLLVVDYFSRYPEVIRLRNTTSQAIIAALKSIFSQHGIPATVLSDNGPQYASQEFADFASSYQFAHVTSSPHFPQSNGLAERTVKTVKSLLKDAEDSYTALLAYRATPLPWCGRSPAELLMGRNLRSSLPQSTASLIPQWPYLTEFRQAVTELGIYLNSPATQKFGSPLTATQQLGGLSLQQTPLDRMLFKLRAVRSVATDPS